MAHWGELMPVLGYCGLTSSLTSGLTSVLTSGLTSGDSSCSEGGGAMRAHNHARWRAETAQLYTDP